MARLITRITALCQRQRDAADLLLARRFRMMRLAHGGDEDCGPGWYDSSRDLERGLQVREGEPGDTLLAEWLAESRRPAPAPRVAATAAAAA